MKHIIGAFGTLVVLMMNIFICISVSNASGMAAEAKEFKAAVVAEIENSNFNPNVINACIAQAINVNIKMYKSSKIKMYKFSNCLF